MYYPFVRKALFQLDQSALMNLHFNNYAALQVRRWKLVRQKVPTKPVTCMGLTFKNPLGLAAGLDKDGSASTR